MDVMNQIIEQSSLQGMPKWFKALAISVFMTIAILLIIMLLLLLTDETITTVSYGYLYK